MMKYMQRMGKSLMLPVAALPAAAILMGIGYWIDPTGWGANSIIAAFMLKAGGALIDNMGILFAIGIGVGMSDDGDGTAGLAALVSWLIITTLLSSGSVAMFMGLADPTKAPVAFSKIANQFIGIVAGLIASHSYNRFKNVRLPDALAFFSGKRSVAIVTALFSLLAAAILFFAWPPIYNGLVAFGESIISLGPVGAGIYGFLNRLLIPFGLHHTVNSVFWFDVAGINDLGKFWNPALGGIKGQTGMYMTGFFPVMMFGLPGAALAMYMTAKSNKKKIAYGLLLSAALSSFFTGVTEPLEFAFMFMAPALYFVHAVLTGIFVGIAAALPVRAGFNFSAGLVDFVLSAKSPMAMNLWILLVLGAIAFVVYFAIFYFMIKKFDFRTPGREDDDTDAELRVELKNDDFTKMAEIILEGIGGRENVTSLENCITRLRFEIKDQAVVDEKKIKSTGVPGIIRPGKNSLQVIVGTKVQFVADELQKML